MASDDAPHLPSLVATEQMQLSLPTRPDWIEATVEYLRQKAVLCGACGESRSGKLMIALHEALSNAIVHGNLELSSELKEQGDDAFAEALAQRASDPRLGGRQVDVVTDYDGQRCQWIITDQGPGFNFARHIEPQDSADPEAFLASGRGILLMRAFLDELRYEYGGRRQILTLRRESTEEKRQGPRLPVLQPLRVVPVAPDGSVDWDAAYQAVARNVSTDGVGLLQEGLARSSRVLIGIVANEQLVYIPAEIRHFRALTGDLVELGCRFESPAGAGLPSAGGALQQAQQAIAELIQRRGQSPLPQDERRAYPRVAFNERIDIQLAGSSEAVVGYARDLSKGGIAFVTTMPLPRETVTIRLPTREGPPLALHAEILRCNRVQENLYDVGAQFRELASG